MRTYDVDPIEQENGFSGFKLYCFEDDDCIWEAYFLNKFDAEDIGDQFIEGKFEDGFPYPSQN